jgi:hypothetical protein
MKRMIAMTKIIGGMPIPGIHGNPQGNPHGNPHGNPQGKPIEDAKTAKKPMTTRVPMMIPHIGVPVPVPKQMLSSYFLR